MVQYIPPPDPNLIFPQRGPGMGALFGQGMAQGMGNWPQAFGNIYRKKQEDQKKQELIDKLSKAFGGGPSATPQVSPTAGVGGVTQAPSSQPQSTMMDQKISQIMPLLLQLGITNPHLAPMLGHLMTSMFPKKSSQAPMVDTKWGPMSPYQLAGREQADVRLNLVKERMATESARIQEAVATNTEKEYNLSSAPLDQASKDLMEIHQLRAKLPAGTTDNDLARAWEHLIPKTGVVKDPLFGSINPELKNYVQKVYSLQANLQKRAMNVRDPHAFTYQTLFNLVPSQKLPSLPEMDRSLQQFRSNVMSIKRTVRQQAAAKYRLMGMQQFNQMQQQISSDPDLMLPQESDTGQHDAVEAELYGD